jgi:transcriptional regulator with XRE-family HTH domain
VEELHIPEELVTLGSAVVWARARRGMGRADVARALRCSLAHIRRIESGQAGRRACHDLAAGLGVPLAELLSRPEGAATAEIAKAADGRALRGRPLMFDALDERRCGLCRKRDHLTAGCPLKQRHPRKFCRNCMDLPHRRPRKGLCWCGQPYEPEPVARAESYPRSSAGYAADLGDSAHFSHQPKRARTRKAREAAA